MINVSPIRTSADYEAALDRINSLMDAKTETSEGDELDILVTLVEAYEKVIFPIESPDPVEFIKNVMEFRGLSQTALAELLNSRSRASEILGRKRPLTLSQIRRISHEWRVPSDPLIVEYPLNL